MVCFVKYFVAIIFLNLIYSISLIMIKDWKLFENPPCHNEFKAFIDEETILEGQSYSEKKKICKN